MADKSGDREGLFSNRIDKTLSSGQPKKHYIHASSGVNSQGL